MPALDQVLNSKAKRPPKLPSQKVLRETYASMARLRAIDEEAKELAAEGRVSYYHSMERKEAVAVGVAQAMKSGDWLFAGAQVPDGGGLDLTCGQPIQLVNTSSPGGSRIGHAVGVAWAAHIQGHDTAACVMFGESLAQQDHFHVGLNFAGVYKLPVVFVCHTTGEYTDTAADTISSRAEAYDLHEVRVDGSDALAVTKVVSAALKRARKGDGATLIEAIIPTDGPDPVMQLGTRLVQMDIWRAQDEEALEEELNNTRLSAARAACAPATGAELFDHVMATPSKTLMEQREGKNPCLGTTE